MIINVTLTPGVKINTCYRHKLVNALQHKRNQQKSKFKNHFHHQSHILVVYLQTNSKQSVCNEQ